MTSITQERAIRVPLFSRRTLTVARVLLTDAWALPGWPVLVMGSSFLVNLLIFAAIGDAVQHPATGGLGSVYVLQLVVSWLSVRQHFSFVVGLNASRRAYYGGVGLVSLAQSVCIGLLLYGCAVAERATGGWGVNMSFFAPLPLMRGPWFEAIAVYAVPMILMSCLGVFLGSVSKRWGSNGVLVLSVACSLVLGGLIALITLLNEWTAVGAWLATRSWLSVVIGWSLVPAALAGVAGWLVLRRAVP
jgi:hypothetical protein